MPSEAVCELCEHPVSAAVGRPKHLRLPATGTDVDLCSDCYIATGDGADEEFLEFLLTVPQI